MGHSWLSNCQVKATPDGKKLVTLPRPELLFTHPSVLLPEKAEISSTDDQMLESDDEKDALH